MIVNALTLYRPILPVIGKINRKTRPLRYKKTVAGTE